MPSYPDWRQTVRYSPDGPAATVLHESVELKVVLVGLEPGQQLPAHPAPAASFHFLDGTGTMTVDEERLDVRPGCTVVVPSGARRGVIADTRLAFLGTLGNPAADTAEEADAAVTRIRPGA